MDLDRIKELLRIVAESGVSEVEIEDGDLKLVVRKNAPSVSVHPGPAGMPWPYPPMAPMAPMAAPAMPAPAAPPATAPAASSPASAAATSAEPAAPAGEAIRAPIVGTFYRSPSPDEDAYVSVGDRVKPGDVLCIIEAMKLMNEVECEVSGVIKEVLVENAQPVEFDQPLFIIDLE